ncbi:hypothetical protein NVP1184A_06 [Vibrio phage 1.184.A._10N.286.49.A5]|nr:hypothetical protein NVP1184A_06 [Vibrio phage 1.184.A._10N.286.49.A5]
MSTARIIYIAGLQTVPNLPGRKLPIAPFWAYPDQPLVREQLALHHEPEVFNE